jgi:hypothetical protein
LGIVSGNRYPDHAAKCPKIASLDMHTPEGIKIFSPLADVKKAYPEVKVSPEDAGSGSDLTVPVPGNAKAAYDFEVTDNLLKLKLNSNECQVRWPVQLCHPAWLRPPF